MQGKNASPAWYASVKQQKVDYFDMISDNDEEEKSQTMKWIVITIKKYIRNFLRGYALDDNVNF